MPRRGENPSPRSAGKGVVGRGGQRWGPTPLTELVFFQVTKPAGSFWSAVPRGGRAPGVSGSACAPVPQRRVQPGERAPKQKTFPLGKGSSASGFLPILSPRSRLCRFPSSLGGGEGPSRFPRSEAMPVSPCRERQRPAVCPRHDCGRIQPLLPVSVHLQVIFLRFYLWFRCREGESLVLRAPFLMILPSKDVISLLQPSPLQTPLSRERFTHFFKSPYY